MAIANLIHNRLSQILPGWLRVIPALDGVSVHAHHPVCGNHRIVELWQDMFGEWRWHSLYLDESPSGTGTVFEGLVAVQKATKIASNMD